jgi:CRP-like cAMP-binding protein
MALSSDQDHNVLLKNLVPLNALSDEHLGQLVSRITIEKATKGDYLFREGDTDHQHVYLLSGHVSLLAGDKEVDVVQSGSNTARFAIAHQWPRKFSARALNAVRLVRIDSQVLSELLVRTQSQSYRVSELDSDANGDWMSRVLRSSVFQQMPPSNIQSVLRRMEQVDVHTGDVIVRQGDPGDYYYVLINGTCRVSRFVGGENAEVARLGPGDSFGEEALLSDTPRSGTVTMTSAGMLMRLSKDDFIELIQRPLIKSLDLTAAEAKVESGSRWLDVRDSADFDHAHFTGAVNIPLNELRGRSSELPLDDSYVVCGDSPADSAIAAFLLRERGLEVSVLSDAMHSLESLRPANALEQEGDSLSLDADTAFLPDNPDSEPPPLVERLNDSPQALRQQLEQTQARFHKALYQRVAQLRRMKQLLQDERAKNAALRQELELARTANQASNQAAEAATSAAQSVASGVAEVARLQAQVEELQRDLDEAQEVLQEASAEESTHQWEKVRWQSQLDALQKNLLEQQEINRILREESEETTRRMESLRDEISRLQGGDQQQVG